MIAKSSKCKHVINDHEQLNIQYQYPTVMDK